MVCWVIVLHSLAVKVIHRAWVRDQWMDGAGNVGFG
jgi:hypothetical protein